MKPKIFFLAALALVAASCTQNEPVEQPQPRILRVSATVEEPAAPRATIEELPGGAIRYRWETGDIIQLAFVQGTVKKLADATVTGVSPDGRTAQFTATVPGEITAADFTLYAYRSSKKESISSGNNLELQNDGKVIAVLPGSPWNYSGNAEEQRHLVSLWGKQAVAYSGGAMPAVSLPLQHLGAMMTVKINNTTGAAIDDIKTLYFFNEDNRLWLINESNLGLAEFEVETGQYTKKEENFRFRVPLSNMPAGESSHLRWFVPDTTAFTPTPYQIKVDAYNSNGEIIGTTAAGKTAIDFRPGNNYIVYLKISNNDPSSSEKYKLEYSNSAWQ